MKISTVCANVLKNCVSKRPGKIRTSPANRLLPCRRRRVYCAFQLGFPANGALGYGANSILVSGFYYGRNLHLAPQPIFNFPRAWRAQHFG